jgi:hypothetical protein
MLRDDNQINPELSGIKDKTIISNGRWFLPAGQGGADHTGLTMSFVERLDGGHGSARGRLAG